MPVVAVLPVLYPFCRQRGRQPAMLSSSSAALQLVKRKSSRKGCEYSWKGSFLGSSRDSHPRILDPVSLSLLCFYLRVARQLPS